MSMPIIVAGCDTEVGKTLTSMILSIALKANYWKPIDCGSKEENDTYTAQKYLQHASIKIFPPAFAFDIPCSPHLASKVKSQTIEKEKCLNLPSDANPLIIELAGGVLSPLTDRETNLDFFSSIDAKWILVSRHYLGSLNHTLLTLEAMKSSGVHLAGIIFNGDLDPEYESPIFHRAPCPVIGRIQEEKSISNRIIEGYAKKWLPYLHPLK